MLYNKVIFLSEISFENIWSVKYLSRTIKIKYKIETQYRIQKNPSRQEVGN